MALKALVQHRVKEEKVSKEEKRAAAERIKAFDSALDRLRAYGAAADPSGAGAQTGGMTRADADQIVVATTKGRSAISPPRLTEALERAIALHTASADGAVIDATSGLTTEDLALLLPVARQTLYDAREEAEAARRQRTTNMVLLAVAFVVVVAGVWLAVRG